MDKHSNNILIKKLEEKNICFQSREKSKFNNYSYYQVINAYKSLFVSKVEKIDDIYNNIINGNNLEDYKKYFGIYGSSNLFNDICKKICKKYGLSYSENMKENQLIKNINGIKYIHHIYPLGTQYSDFLRMYKFEHELRTLLLKYTLIIEESIKNVFIKYLNNCPDVKANFLSDINNYDTSNGNNYAIDTLKLILEKQKNKHSKPISRKRDQDLGIPYWILINELSINETYNVISNLKPDRKIMIFELCVNHFTKLKLDINNKAKSKKTISKERGLIKSFATLIEYIGKFRNLLAHNQPIFSYNHNDISLFSFPKMEYEYPRIKNKIEGTPTIIQQHKINSVTMYDFIHFFGRDFYNKNNSSKDINLSFMIYLIYKMISTVDKNTMFYKELMNLYSKYNILINKDNFEVYNVSKVQELLNEISNFDKINLDVNNLFFNIENKKSYKLEIKKFYRDYKNQIKRINKISKNIKITNNSKYKNFKNNSRYTLYTGIDINFLINLK